MGYSERRKENRDSPGLGPGNHKERSTGYTPVIESDNKVGVIEHFDISNQRGIPPVKVIIRDEYPGRNIPLFGLFLHLGIKSYSAAMEPSRPGIFFRDFLKDRNLGPFIPMAGKYNVHALYINESKRYVKSRL